MCRIAEKYSILPSSSKSVPPMLSCPDVSDQVGEDFGSQFSDIEVVSTSGEPVALPELWASRLVVVAWARHFGYGTVLKVQSITNAASVMR